MDSLLIQDFPFCNFICISSLSCSNAASVAAKTVKLPGSPSFSNKSAFEATVKMRKS